jgi:T4 RnlA family RNA ligase
MSPQLPSYQQALYICENSNGIFYESKFDINGYSVSVFNYRLATYNDFVLHNALELRGLTFVFNQDGSLYRTYPLFDKFFNLNENESTLFEKVGEKKISSVYLKEDGSIISFIKLPNGKIVSKSKNSFSSDQAILSMKLFDNDQKLKSFVSECLDNNFNPIFELVSPKNRIVVNYQSTKLVLLAVRDNLGNYLDIKEFDWEKPMNFGSTINDLINLKSQLEGLEGWVVLFEDGQRIKIKTDWYLSLHRIMTDYSNREDYLIDMILDEKIDDVLSVLDIGSENRRFVQSVIDKTNFILNSYVNEINRLISTYDGDRKDFAIKNHKNELFALVMKVIDGSDLMECLKEYVKKKTYRLHQAKQWLLII